MVKATVCKTVYRRVESRPWDHLLASESAPWGADSSCSRAADSYRDSNAGRVRIIGRIPRASRRSYAPLMAQNGVKRVRSLLLHRHRHVRVKFERRADTRVAEHLRDDFGMHAASQEQSRRGMAQIVEGQDAGLLLAEPPAGRFVTSGDSMSSGSSRLQAPRLSTSRTNSWSRRARATSRSPWSGARRTRCRSPAQRARAAPASRRRSRRRSSRACPSPCRRACRCPRARADPVASGRARGTRRRPSGSAPPSSSVS